MTGIDATIAVGGLTFELFRAPLKTPRCNAFGIQTSRPALLVRLEDSKGNFGWGEVFANWPPPGAEHRARLLRDVFTPMVEGKTYADPPSLWIELTEAMRLLALQCDEPGPFAQIIAGIDIAAWDLIARRAGLPLWRILGNNDTPHPLPAYASGLNRGQIENIHGDLATQGYQGFKLKVGFGRETDIAALKELRAAVGDDATVMADANQVWSVPAALEMAEAMAEFNLTWLEEPLACDASCVNWVRLAEKCPIPLAAGENIRGVSRFADARQYLTYVQPDVIKWGGLSMVRRIAAECIRAGKTFCPHYLGGAVGLLASAHLLAAMGNGWLEVDCNPNPLRTEMTLRPITVQDGQFVLPTGTGLGTEPDMARLAEWRVNVID